MNPKKWNIIFISQSSRKLQWPTGMYACYEKAVETTLKEASWSRRQSAADKSVPLLVVVPAELTQLRSERVYIFLQPLSALTFHSHLSTFPRPSSVGGALFQAVKKCAHSYIRRKPIDVPSSSSHICGSKVDFEQLYRLSPISVRIELHRPLAIEASLDYISRCKFGHAARTRNRCWSRS